jgi:hypothetical protein
MTLEQRYRAAPATSYVGRVKTEQALPATADPQKGVDFMDAGFGKGGADSMQSNFQRRKSEDKVVTQGTDTTYTPDELKGSSRWYGRALNYAFTNPASTTTGITISQWTAHKSVRPGTKDSWSDNVSNFHRWTPTAKFEASAGLSALAKTRATGKKPAPPART